MWLHRFATLVATATFVLILAGGMVTSTGSGLAVPDWPTSYGYSMIGFPLSKMVGGIFYEHGHRLIASTVGCLMIILAIWLWRKDPREWVKRLGAVALGTVVLQGLLGGLTVRFFLPDAISIAHAGLAQIFFCLTVTMALVTSPGWTREAHAVPSAARTEHSFLPKVAAITTGLVYLQIILGAIMRHTGAGLAIPDFPLVFGGLLPPDWTAPIAIHFVHRVGAACVLTAILITASRLRADRASTAGMRKLSAGLVLLVLVQILLGGWTVLSGRSPIINTAHVGTGALVLASSLVLTLQLCKPLILGTRQMVRSGVSASRMVGRSSEVRA